MFGVCYCNSQTDLHRSDASQVLVNSCRAFLAMVFCQSTHYSWLANQKSSLGEKTASKEKKKEVLHSGARRTPYSPSFCLRRALIWRGKPYSFNTLKGTFCPVSLLSLDPLQLSLAVYSSILIRLVVWLSSLLRTLCLLVSYLGWIFLSSKLARECSSLFFSMFLGSLDAVLSRSVASLGWVGSQKSFRLVLCPVDESF